MKKAKLLFVPLVGKTSACRQKEGLKLIKNLPLLPRLAAVLPPQGREMKRGFTLIELLVVVLIIGILTAVALPQYHKAVWRSRNAILKSVGHEVALAEHRYYLEHGQYAANFNQLDIDLPLAKPTSKGTETSYSIYSNVCNLATSGSDAIRRGKDYDVILNATNLKAGVSVIVIWTTGPYACAGFSRSDQANSYYCYEARNGSYKNSPGAFCEKLEKGILLPGASANTGAKYNISQ